MFDDLAFLGLVHVGNFALDHIRAYKHHRAFGERKDAVANDEDRSDKEGFLTKGAFLNKRCDKTKTKKYRHGSNPKNSHDKHPVHNRTASKCKRSKDIDQATRY